MFRLYFDALFTSFSLMGLTINTVQLIAVSALDTLSYFGMQMVYKISKVGLILYTANARARYVQK